MSQGLHLPDQIRAVLFDCDGTILNSEPLHAENLSKVLNEYGLRISANEITQRFRGFHDEQVFEELFNEHTTLSKEEFLQKKTTSLLNHLNRMPEPMLQALLTPGFIDAFKYLKQSKFLVGVVSASEEVFLESLLNRLGIRKELDILVHGGSTLLPKPSPAPYIKALRALEIHPDEVVIFEDSPTGIESALGTGAETVWVNGHHNELEHPSFAEIPSCDNFFWLIPSKDK